MAFSHHFSILEYRPSRVVHSSVGSPSRHMQTRPERVEWLVLRPWTMTAGGRNGHAGAMTISIVFASVSGSKAGWTSPVHRGGSDSLTFRNPADASSLVKFSRDSRWKCSSVIIAIQTYGPRSAAGPPVCPRQVPHGWRPYPPACWATCSHPRRQWSSCRSSRRTVSSRC